MTEEKPSTNGHSIASQNNSEETTQGNGVHNIAKDDNMESNAMENDDTEQESLANGDSSHSAGDKTTTGKKRKGSKKASRFLVTFSVSGLYTNVPAVTCIFELQLKGIYISSLWVNRLILHIIAFYCLMPWTANYIFCEYNDQLQGAK